MKAKLELITQILKKESLRVTRTRLAVAEIFIKHSNTYLTPEEIYQKIFKSKKVSCDQVSVYRILAKFEELGLVKKSDFNNDASRYIWDESLGQNKKQAHSHEHYFKCESCSSVEAFSDCFISSKEKELKASGYTNLKHHIEITGFCPSCS